MEQNLVKVEEPIPADAGLIEEKIKSRRVLKQLKEQSSSYKFYSWDFRENYSYITYLKNFRYIFNSHAQRKRLRVFTHISRLIQTRNAHQIKSHHQKMMLRHRTVDGIIEHFRIKITRLLQNQPQHITAIQEINLKAEEFFRQEAGFDQKPSQRQSKKLKKTQTDEKHAGDPQNAKIKVEQQATDYRYEQFKNSEILGGVPEVKTEENAPTICFLPN